MMIEIERSERKEESEENDAKSNYLRDKERMMERYSKRQKDKVRDRDRVIEIWKY